MRILCSSPHKGKNWGLSCRLCFISVAKIQKLLPNFQIFSDFFPITIPKSEYIPFKTQKIVVR